MPIELTFETVHGTWKLSQNKTDNARLCAAEHVAAEGSGQENVRLAELLRKTREPR